jgi:hypothetical protein
VAQVKDDLLALQWLHYRHSSSSSSSLAVTLVTVVPIAPLRFWDRPAAIIAAAAAATATATAVAWWPPRQWRRMLQLLCIWEHGNRRRFQT